MFKSFIQRRLENGVLKYFVKHPEVKLVAVSGSVGKTTTRTQIAAVLSEKFRVRTHGGNHNSQLSAPLAILGVEYPNNIRNPLQWMAVFRAVSRRIKEPSDVDVIVQELGSDRIGEIAHFGTYLKPDIGVVTAVSPEHMEYFHDIDTVAKEELELANFSKAALINREDIDGKFAKYLTNPNVNTYGNSAVAEYHFIESDYNAKDGFIGLLSAPEWSDPMPAVINIFGEHMLRPVMAACAVGIKLGMNSSELTNGIAKLQSIPGRMSKLRGVRGSIIIDDSYNSSPLAAAAALRELYKIPASQHIAVLGDMNELGESSASEHEAVGNLCDPNVLNWVVTVGDQSAKYIAPIAKSKGCQVKSFGNALSAGAFVNSIIEDGTVVLFKGSQGGIYLEEAIKIILHSSDDENKLVRQSPEWMKTKNKFFSKI